MRILLLIAALLLAWGPALPTAALATPVGRLTQIEGGVDILRGGKLPATPASVGDQVDAGDVLRTKSLSKAQITFIDQSIINLSPGSRLAIDEYQFEPAQGKRRAMLSLFQGLAHVVVNKLLKVEEPDFIIKSHTAITGVRGTDFGIRLAPNSSTILNFSGATRVGNIFPEAHTWERLAPKIAFQPPGGGSFFVPGGFVDLQGMQGTTVQSNLPPTLPFAITSQDRQQFMNQMVGGTPGQQSSGNPGASPGVGPTSSTTVTATANLGLTSGTGDTAVTILNTVTVPPSVAPSPNPSPTPGPTPTPTPSNFSFTQQYYGAWVQMADAPYSQSSLAVYSWGQRTGVYDGSFYGSSTATRTATSGTPYASLTTGTSMGTSTGTVTGFLGQALTGTMTYTGTNSLGSTINRTGTVTILPTGALTYNWTDTVKVGSVTTATGVGTSTQTPGTYLSQNASGYFTSTANQAGNQSTSTNAGDLTGTRTMAGITSSFRTGFSVTNTAPNASTFIGSESGTISTSSRGVLGAPDASGVRTGVMTNVVTISTSPNSGTSGGLVKYVPASGLAPEATFAQIIGDTPSQGRTEIGMWAQTADTGAIIKTQTYEGNHTISPSGGTTGTLSGSGWGNRVEAGGTPIPSYGTLTGTVTDTSGQTLTSKQILNQTLAAVVKPDATYSTYSGPAQGIGVGNNNGIVSTTGTVTINSGNVLTHQFNGTFIDSGGRGTITSGTQTMTPGESFTQGATGNLLSTSSGPNYQVQTNTNPAAIAGSRSGNTPVMPGTFVISPNQFNATNTAIAPNAFPPSTNNNVIIHSQGVIIPNAGSTGGSGAMTVNIQSAVTTGGPVATVMGPATITPTGVLNAGNLVGKNIVTSPTGQRIPATQVGTVVQNPAAR